MFIRDTLGRCQAVFLAAMFAITSWTHTAGQLIQLSPVCGWMHSSWCWRWRVQRRHSSPAGRARLNKTLWVRCDYGRRISWVSVMTGSTLGSAGFRTRSSSNSRLPLSRLSPLLSPSASSRGRLDGLSKSTPFPKPPQRYLLRRICLSHTGGSRPKPPKLRRS